jgi:hypothetical protein
MKLIFASSLNIRKLLKFMFYFQYFVFKSVSELLTRMKIQLLEALHSLIASIGHAILLRNSSIIHTDGCTFSTLLHLHRITGFK